MHINEKIQSLEKQYWEIQSKSKIYQITNPINLKEEKEKFLISDKRKNPIFQYKQIPQTKKLKITLEEIKKKFKELKNDHFLVNEYLNLIKKDLKIIDYIHTKNPSLLTSLYGYPQKAIILQAEKILYKNYPKENTAEITPEQVQKFLDQQQKNYPFLKDWKIKITDITAKMAVNNTRKELKINTSARFSQEELKRLLVHEIETHILRAYNGNKQEYIIFEKGFPHYLETEEGLAVLSEEKSGVLSNKDLQKYALRVKLSELTKNMDFLKLFHYAKKFTTEEIAFDHVARIKRGLGDTSIKGGYTKDQVYFTGYQKLKKLNDNELKKLFIGKISVEFLKKNKNYPESHILLPKWLKNNE